MIVASHEQPFSDDYSAEIIAKVRELSPDLDAYVSQEQYLIETDQENVSPLWLRNRLICKLVDELTEMGVSLNVEVDDVCDSPVFVQAALYLRSKFDAQRFYSFLKDHRNLADYVREVVVGDSAIEDIVGYCASNLPLDEGWGYLQRMIDGRPGFIEVSEKFVETMNEVLDLLDRLGEPDLITAENGDLVRTYIDYIGTRKQNVLKYATTIYSSKVGLEGATEQVNSKVIAVEKYMNGYEKEIGRASVIGSFDPEQKQIDLGSVRGKYLDRWDHTLEHWCHPDNAGKIPTNLTFSVLVATLFVDFGADNEARVRVVQEFEDAADKLGDRYDTMRDMLDNALGNLVVLEEGIKC